MSEKHPLMTATEVAELFGVHVVTVARWRTTGKLASINLSGKTNRFFRAEVEAILNGKPLTPGELAAAREQAISGAR